MKSQRLTQIILVLVSALLLFEFADKRFFSSSKKATDENTNSDQNTENNTANSVSDSTTTPISDADSIAALYAPAAFKDAQMKKERVKTAYKNYGQKIRDLYKDNKLDEESLEIYLRAFKKEKLIEVWAKDKDKDEYLLLTTYNFCTSSGTLGPKRKEGDNQIPEGFYRIVTFNPESKFHLSLGVNYPNKSDRILGDTTNLGGDIFIHGDCVTVGCIPITDEKIQELYIMAVDAKAAGNGRVPVSIFPAKLDKANFDALKEEFADRPDLIKFWTPLRDGYQLFNKCKKLPSITFGSDGSYACKPGC